MSADQLPAKLDAPQLPAELPEVGILDLYQALLAHATNPRTHRAREQDCADLARFLDAPDPARACAAFVMKGSRQANAIALAYQRSMLDRGLSSATVNRRLSTLRLLVKLARRFSLADWVLEVDGMRVEPYRDTTGPGRAGWLRMHRLAAALARLPRGAEGAAKAKRDLCLLLLLRDHGLRRAEVAALDLADWDPDSGKLWITGKGRSQKTRITINARTVVALAEWIECRGVEPGPLFTRLDRGRRGRAAGQLERLDGDGILWVVADLGRKAGLSKRVRPHGLRHEAITEVLDATSGNIRDAQKFGRHKDPKTTQKYDDAREDVAGKMARLLGELG